MLVMPCERALWKVLPSIRKELAIYMVKEKNIQRKKVSKLLGLTEPALCQYLKNKRGSIKFTKKQKKSIRQVADELLKLKPAKNVFISKICRLCKIVGSCTP